MNKLFVSLTLILLLVFNPELNAQNTPRNVAIVVYEGAEILDFAGPAEVFAAASGFAGNALNVYLVAAGAGPVTSQGFIQVTPNYSIHNCPPPDIVIIPGGSSGNLLNNPDFMTWLEKVSHTWTMGMSVCTGVSPFAKLGLLDGRIATSWYGQLDRYSENYPQIDWRRETRFVDNGGKIITTAGVSAGIDGALHVVSKLFGMPVALQTARYMEYDKWDPEAGLIVPSAFAKKLEEEGVTAALASAGQDGEVPYQGELINLGRSLLDQGKAAEAAEVLEFTTSRFPAFFHTYSLLGEAYRKTGKPAPPTSEELEGMMTKGDATALRSSFEKMQRTDPNWQLWEENRLNFAGYQFLQQEKYDTAIALFQLNVEAFPESFNAYDSLGEAYMLAGQTEPAVRNYEKSLKLNPGNDNAVKMLEKLRSGQ